MIRLFQLIRKYHYVILFIALQGIAFWILFDHNNYHHSIYFNKSTELAGHYFKSVYNAKKYFHLAQVNDSLLAENAQLKSELSKYRKTYPNRQVFDSNANYGFLYKTAHVISNSTDNQNNLIFLDIGQNSGISKHQGIINYDGIVGLVKTVSPNFSMGISILNSDFKVNAKIEELNELGSVTWDGKSTEYVILNDIPNNVSVEKGQHVLVGPYSGFFPEDYPIGIIESFTFIKGGSFYNIKVKLNVNMKNIGSVYVVKKILSEELDSLQNTIANE